jgi:nucleoside-diphosphate-sugar epimerase
MKKVAVVGALGYVGSQIACAVKASCFYRLIPVLRTDNQEKLFADADIIIHSANPARRHQAEKNPVRDFEETVEKTARFLTLAKNKRFVLISTISCRTQLSTSYGRNRRACELLALLQDSLVIRLGPMFGGNRTNDTLHDIIAGRRVFVSSETRYAYADIAWVGQKVVELLKASGGLYEIGARNSICLRDLCNHFSSTSTFSGVNDTQIPENFADGPDVNDVLKFAKKEKMRIDEWNKIFL